MNDTSCRNRNLAGEGWIVHKPCGKRGDVERNEVIDPFADADVGHRRPDFFDHRDDNPPLGRPVEFGEDEAGDADLLVEEVCLRQGVLSGGGIEDQRPFVRRIGGLGDDPLYLGEFGHQVAAGLQTPRRVDEEHIDPPRTGGMDGIVYHGGGIGPRLVTD